MQMRKLSWDEERLIYDNSVQGGLPCWLAYLQDQTEMVEARTQRWALGDALTRIPTGWSWPETLAPWWPFLEKKGFVSKALASEDLNESLDPAVSIVTPGPQLALLSNESAPEQGFSSFKMSTNHLVILLRCRFWFSGSGLGLQFSFLITHLLMPILLLVYGIQFKYQGSRS